jgi:hypothetical protein
MVLPMELSSKQIPKYGDVHEIRTLRKFIISNHRSYLYLVDSCFILSLTKLPVCFRAIFQAKFVKQKSFFAIFPLHGVFDFS